jgi:membrane protease YdiL (CAAX protease family)
LLYPAAVWFAAYGIDRLLGNDYQVTFFAISRMFRPEQACMVVVALVFVLPNTLGEELGWRGFALPELLQVRGPLASSLVLGGVWAVWHLPMWLMYGKTGLPLATSAVWTVAIAVVFTWIYCGSGNRLPLAWLFHASLTATGYLLSSIPTHTDDLLHLLAAVAAGTMMVVGTRRPVERPAIID